MMNFKTDIYSELDEKTYELLLSRASEVASEYFDRIVSSISGEQYDKWQIPDRIELIHQDIDRHYFSNKERFDEIFDYRPVYKATLKLKEDGKLRTDPQVFSAVAIIYDEVMRNTQINLLKITDNLMGKIRAMDSEARLESQEMAFLERISATKIMDATASMASLRRRDIEKLGLKHIPEDLASELSTPSKIWEKRLGEEKALVRYVYAETKISEEVFGRQSDVSSKFLADSIEPTRNFRRDYAMAMRGLDMGLETDPYSQLEEKERETLISDTGLIKTDLSFPHAQRNSNYEGLSIHKLSRKDQVDFFSTAISEYCLSRIKDERRVGGGELPGLIDESLKLSNDLMAIYSDKFQIAHFKDPDFKSEVRSLAMLKAAISVEKGINPDPMLSKTLAEKSEFSVEELMMVEKHHGINLMQGTNIQAKISNGLER